jgi:hypothetical protein
MRKPLFLIKGIIDEGIQLRKDMTVFITSARSLPSLNVLRLMTLVFLFSMLSGCGGVSEKQQEKIAQIVLATSPQFEQETQQLLAADKRLSKLKNGEWKWEYQKGDKGKLLAQYGYKGDLPWWKTLLQVAIGPLANVFMNTDDYFFRTLEVDLEMKTSKLVEIKN